MMDPQSPGGTQSIAVRGDNLLAVLTPRLNPRFPDVNVFDLNPFFVYPCGYLLPVGALPLVSGSGSIVRNPYRSDVY